MHYPAASPGSDPVDVDTRRTCVVVAHANGDALAAGLDGDLQAATSLPETIGHELTGDERRVVHDLRR